MSDSNNDYTNLIIFITLGLPLLGSYASLKTNSKKQLKSLWSNRGQNNITKYGLANFFYISMFLAALSGIYLFYYLTWSLSTDSKIFGYKYENDGKYFIYTALCILIGFSILWLPSFYYNNNNLIKFVLFIVAIGAVLLMASISSIENPNDQTKVAIASCAYMAFHTFVLDFIIWSGSI
jgi:hypothetical protein